MLNRWLNVALLCALVGLCRSGEPGLRVRRRPSESDEDRHRVTIDLSALRPSMPGLVLYKYGDLAPKLVQVDLSSLNPHLQPHVIWPQFNEMEVDERPYDLDEQEAIPYLTEEESIMSPRRLAKMMASANWLDQSSNNDIYDFVPDSNQVLSLQGSLPLADEVIVPLDWEEKTKRDSEKKRNVFITRGWRAGGEKEHTHKTPAILRKGSDPRANQYYNRNLGGLFHGFPAKMIPMRETESEDGPSRTRAPTNAQLGKKDLPIPQRHHMPKGGPQAAGPQAAGPQQQQQQQGDDESPPVRIPSRESWSVPRQYWTVPHLFVNNWQ